MVTFNVDSLDFSDGEAIRTGADDDFSTRYSSSNDRLEIEDLTNATVGHIPRDTGTDLVGGKFAETVSEGKVLTDNGNVFDSDDMGSAKNDASSFMKLGPGIFKGLNADSNGLTVIGSGRRTVIKKTGVALFLNAEDVTMRNLSIESTDDDCVRDSSVGENALFDNVTIRGAKGRGMDLTNGNGKHHIHNCRFESGITRRGIFTTAGSQNIVTNCVFDGVVSNNLEIRTDDSIAFNNQLKSSPNNPIVIKASDCIVGANQMRDFGDRLGVFSGSDNIIFNNRLSNVNGGIDNRATGTVLDGNLIT
jgi:hypothetical protein